MIFFFFQIFFIVAEHVFIYDAKNSIHDSTLHLTMIKKRRIKRSVEFEIQLFGWRCETQYLNGQQKINKVAVGLRPWIRDCLNFHVRAELFPFWEMQVANPVGGFFSNERDNIL